MTYYNENDRAAAAWLRKLMKERLIADGEVDERSITEVQPGDVPARAHFFAGIGGWDLALSLAGWPTDWPVWTGSCPCQPFSAAGKREGVEDPRHLWPELLRLIAERRPPAIFGEQVGSADGLVWLAGVRTNLEALGYAVGAANLPAAGIGAPHIRQRIFWVAYAPCDRFNGPKRTDGEPHGEGEGAGRVDAGGSRKICGMEYAEGDGREQWRPESSQWGASGRRGADGKWRRIEPGIEPLAHGVPGRVGLLRGYGNAIIPRLAAEFVGAVMDLIKAKEIENANQ